MLATTTAQHCAPHRSHFTRAQQACSACLATLAHPNSFSPRPFPTLFYSPPLSIFLMKTDVNLEEENITEEGYAFYRFLRDGALKPVPIPHICVYLDAAAQLCLDRVNSRNRGCESGIPVAYLEKLGKVRVHRLTVVPVPRRPNGCIGAGRCFHNKAFALIFIPHHLLMFCFCFL